MNFLGFTSDESFPYVALLVVTIYTLISNYRKGSVDLWSPISIILIVFSYYCLLGPYQAITSGKFNDRMINMRPFYTSAFWGALICVLSCILGFHLNTKRGTKMKNEISPKLLSDCGKWICILGFALYTLSTGGNIGKLLNPFDAEGVEHSGGSLSNYLSSSVNFLIPGVTFLFAHYLITRKGLVWLIIMGLIALGLFTTLGFRFRIVLLTLSITITYFLILKKKPNIILAALGVFLFISAMGIMDKTRKYGGGLALEKLEMRNSQTNYESGLNEAKIFQTSGAIIDYVPNKVPYAGFTPIWSALLFPIPRAIYQSKNSADYVLNAISAIYGKKASKGAAFLMYAEHYLAFGWIGIILGGTILGWIFKNLWNWFLANNQNPFVVVVYAVTVSFLYVIISRGYLPQVTMLFFFTVFPAYVGIWAMKRKSPLAA